MKTPVTFGYKLRLFLSAAKLEGKRLARFAENAGIPAERIKQWRRTDPRAPLPSESYWQRLRAAAMQRFESDSSLKTLWEEVVSAFESHKPIRIASQKSGRRGGETTADGYASVTGSSEAGRSRLATKDSTVRPPTMPVAHGSSEHSNTPEFHGLISVSSGEGRDDAFQQIRARATKRIIVVGIGMSKISMYAKQSLSQQARRVPVDLLMIDPDFLNVHSIFGSKLQQFLAIRDFVKNVRSSFNDLRAFAKQWNIAPKNRHRISLRVYSTIPTMSMVAIDPRSTHGELVIEFFLYQSGEHRPRFHIRRTGQHNCLFNQIMAEYERLWASSRKVV